MAGQGGLSAARTFLGLGPLWKQVIAEEGFTEAVLATTIDTLWRRSSWQTYEYTQEMTGRFWFTAGGSEQFPKTQEVRIGQAIALRRSE